MSGASAVLRAQLAGGERAVLVTRWVPRSTPRSSGSTPGRSSTPAPSPRSWALCLPCPAAARSAPSWTPCEDKTVAAEAEPVGNRHLPGMFDHTQADAYARAVSARLLPKGTPLVRGTRTS